MTAAPNTPKSLTHTAARGAMLGSIAALIDRFSALGIQAVLTYILLKEDFGIWSLASPIMALATVMIQTAIRDILIHRSPKFHLWSNPALWLSTTLGVIAALTVMIMGIAASYAYDSPKLTLILLLASLQPLASGITAVSRAKMSIDLRFGTLAAYFCVTSLSNWLLALLLAALGAGVYSFPLGIAITSIVQIIAIWFIAPIKVKSHPQRRRWKYFASDTTTVMASNFARWIRTQGDRLILGFFLTQSMMGVYFLAFQLSLQTFSVITLNLSSVLLPTLATLNHDRERQSKAFIRSLKMLLFLSAPICAGTVVVATPITNLLFDESKWSDLSTTLQLITAGMIFRAVEPPIRSLMNAQGRFRELFYINIASTISFAIFIVAVLLAAGLVEFPNSRLYAAAIAGGLYHIVYAIVLIHYGLKDSPESTFSAVRTLTEPLIYATLAALAAASLTLLVPDSIQSLNANIIDIIKVIIAVLVFMVVYMLIARIRKPQEFNTLAGFAIKAAPNKLRPLIQKTSRILFACDPDSAA
ncbi:MAG: oligosaccharide flippase family protein [Phycisphaerales bacterium]